MAYCSRGAALTHKGKIEPAIASLDEAIRINPRIAANPFYKRYRLAAESLRPKPLNPKFTQETERGLEAFRRGDYERAIASFDTLIRMDPKHSEARRWRGDALLNQHQFDAAIDEYNKAIQIDPRNGMAYCSRGAALTEKGEFERAIASFNEAIRVEPRIADNPFYKRYRAAAEAPSSQGSLMMFPLITAFLLCLEGVRGSTARPAKPEIDPDF
jgi:tetratricopeptide (TPR) repeat protein